jgi:prophage DNA circulation protein
MTSAARQLQTFSFEGVEFPVSSSEVDGGNAIAPHTAYLRPGADVEGCGREPYRGTFTIACFDGLRAPWGNVFTERYFDIIDAFERTSASGGRLRHPTKGTFTAFVGSWKERHDSQQGNGVVIECTFIEHNATAIIVGIAAGTDASGTARAQATAADSAMAAIGG